MFSIPEVNVPGVLVCTVLIFLLGGLWYSPWLFGKRWMALTGRTAEEIAASGGASPAMYLQVFICGFLTAYTIGAVLHHMEYAYTITGVKLAAIWWLGLAGATSYATALFSAKPRALWMIDTGFNLVSFLMTGLILSLWR